MHLIQQYGFFILIPALFVFVGVGMFINITWGLLTGGPRAMNAPGAPYLYDRFYYLLFFVVLIGWSGFLLSILSIVASGKDHVSDTSFIVGWGICAIGMGGILVLRSDMMMRGARYFSEHGFWWTRFYYRMQLRQYDRQPVFLRPLLGGIFIVVGIGVVAFNITHIPDAFHEAVVGAQTLIAIITAP